MPRPRKTRARALLDKARAGTLTPDERLEGRAIFSPEAEADEGDVFMFLRWGIRRMQALYPELLVEPESGNVLGLMTACALTLTKHDQRMRKTMSEVARSLNLSGAAQSRATRVLQAHGVLILPERAGFSRTFELDANLVTMLKEPDRKAAAASQAARLRVQAAQAAGRPRDALGVIDGGRVDDPRQPSLVE